VQLSLPLGALQPPRLVAQELSDLLDWLAPELSDLLEWLAPEASDWLRWLAPVVWGPSSC